MHILPIKSHQRLGEMPSGTGGHLIKALLQIPYYRSALAIRGFGFAAPAAIALPFSCGFHAPAAV